MANTIKVIDLLNKIANGEELPEKIKWNYDENIYTHDGGGYLCYSTGYAKEKAFLEGYRTDMMLHTTVEIIEEQQDIDIQEIEEIGEMLGWALISLEEKIEGQKESINFTLDFFGNKINDLIKNQNKILQAVKQLDNKIKDKE